MKQELAKCLENRFDPAGCRRPALCARAIASMKPSWPCSSRALTSPFASATSARKLKWAAPHSMHTTNQRKHLLQSQLVRIAMPMIRPCPGSPWVARLPRLLCSPARRASTLPFPHERRRRLWCARGAGRHARARRSDSNLDELPPSVNLPPPLVKRFFHLHPSRRRPARACAPRASSPATTCNGSSRS